LSPVAFAVPSALMVPATTSLRFTGGYIGRAPLVATKEHWRRSLARCLVSAAGSHDRPSTAALPTSAAMLVTSTAAERAGPSRSHGKEYKGPWETR
jgi:hypothetical protein